MLGGASRGSCRAGQIAVLGETETELGGIDERELGQLEHHLQRCGPNDGVTTRDGLAPDMDAFARRASAAVTSFYALSRQLTEARALCGG